MISDYMIIRRTIERHYEVDFELGGGHPVWEAEETREYSPDGKLRTLRDKDGKRHEYDYDADGTLYDECVFGPEGMEECHAHCYDETGRLTIEERWRLLQNNKTECDIIMHYWNDESREERVCFRPTDSGAEGSGVATYDDCGRQVSSRSYTEDSIFYKRIRWDSQGHKIAEFCREIYFFDGDCIRDTYVIRYRPDGLPIEETHRIEGDMNGTPSSVNLSKSFEYGFNREGDWVRKTERMGDGRVLREVRRTIEYWDISACDEAAGEDGKA